MTALRHSIEEVAICAPPSVARTAERGLASRRSARASARIKLAVIGNGMASHKLCERLLARGATRSHEVFVFGEEPQPAYDRVRLTQFFHHGDESRMLLAPPDWYTENGIQLFTGDPVVEIDRDSRILRTRGRREVTFEKLVFATGSRAYLPDFPGASLPGVFLYRTLRDLACIKSYAAFGKRAAVLGGGLLGLEAAQALKELGLQTWVVERGVGLMARQLDPAGSRLLQTQVEHLGLRVLTGMQTEHIEPIGTDRLLQFSNGQCLRVQLVVVAAGIRPRDELASACGLEIGPRGGIVVNDFLETGDPNIHAIGECASHRGTTYGLAAPSFQMADVLASNLAGMRRRFPGCDMSTWLKLPGLHVATLGRYQEGETDLCSQGDGSYRRLVFDKNRLVGAVALGEWTDLPRVQELVERRGRVWRWQRERFLRTGCLWLRRAPRPVSEWPASALVCNCVGVRRAALTSACAAGCATVEQLASATGASTVCGSCQPLLAEMVGVSTARVALPGVRWLLIASVAAFALALVVWSMAPIPSSDSVQTGLRLESLWYGSMAKQISGFTLVGLALLSLLLSLRKRFRRFTVGEVGHWRALHAVLGVLTLVALVSHTGFRMGENLNFILMTNFLLLALLGACAGAVNGLETRLPGRAARQLRSLWTWGHISLTWPLPVLVTVHALVAYLF